MKVFNISFCMGLLTAMFCPYAVKSNVDYCNFTTEHLLCNPLKIAETCGSEHKEIPVTDKIKKIIVHQHNYYRNKVAYTGKVIGAHGSRNHIFPTAANMLEISWNKILALAARKMVNRCDLTSYSTNRQRKFPFFKDGVGRLGDNFFIAKGTTKLDWKNVLHIFWVQKEYYRTANLRSFKDRRHGKPVGTTKAATEPLTQILWAKTYLIGCAASSFKASFGYAVNAACLYGPTGNVEEQPVYYARAASCSFCPNNGSCSLSYPGLCSSEHLPKPNMSFCPEGYESYCSNPTYSSASRKFWFFIVAFGTVFLTLLNC